MGRCCPWPVLIVVYVCICIYIYEIVLYMATIGVWTFLLFHCELLWIVQFLDDVRKLEFGCFRMILLCRLLRFRKFHVCNSSEPVHWQVITLDLPVGKNQTSNPRVMGYSVILHLLQMGALPQLSLPFWFAAHFLNGFFILYPKDKRFPHQDRHHVCWSTSPFSEASASIGSMEQTLLLKNVPLVDNNNLD